MGMEALNGAGFQQATRQVSESVQYSSPETVSTAASANMKAQQPQSQFQGKQPTPDQIKSAISTANRRAHFGNTNAEFSYHEATKRISVKIIDKDTNEVIREIPPEETLEMISKMWELCGIMVDEKR